MKLRNKKTDAVANYRIILHRERGNGSNKAPIRYVCGTLAKLNEDWEDYEPVEPLIKDEKICKAVRAWAEAIDAVSLFVEQANFDGEFLELTDTISSIRFHVERPKDIKIGKRYTITELCGEE